MKIRLEYCCWEFNKFLSDFGFEVRSSKIYLFFGTSPKYIFNYCPFCGKNITLEDNNKKREGTDVDSGRD